MRIKHHKRQHNRPTRSIRNQEYIGGSFKDVMSAIGNTLLNVVEQAPAVLERSLPLIGLGANTKRISGVTLQQQGSGLKKMKSSEMMIGSGTRDERARAIIPYRANINVKKVHVSGNGISYEPVR